MPTATAATAHIRFRCPHCGKINKAPRGMIGCGGTCARCKGGVKVPAAGDRTAGPVLRETTAPLPEAKSVVAAPAASSSASRCGTAEKPPQTTKPVQTLEELGELIAQRQEQSASNQEPKPKKEKRSNRMPWWMWGLHLSLPVATVFAVVAIYQARHPAGASPTVGVDGPAAEMVEASASPAPSAVR